jgi:hypothetical protein
MALPSLIAGALAGAAGTTALNAATYLDMAIRGRPTSSTPEDSVEETAHRLGTEIPGDDDTRSNRLQGLGPLLGIGVGVGIGVAAAAVADALPPARALPLPVKMALVGATALIGANAPMTLLGITDPRQWSASDWAADVVPHIAYGAATAATLEYLTSPDALR